MSESVFDDNSLSLSLSLDLSRVSNRNSLHWHNSDRMVMSGINITIDYLEVGL